MVVRLTLRRNSTVGDVARKVMGDVPINYIEGVGGTRVAEDDIVAVGKHDVSLSRLPAPVSGLNIVRFRSCPSKLVDKQWLLPQCTVSMWNIVLSRNDATQIRNQNHARFEIKNTKAPSEMSDEKPSILTSRPITSCLSMK